MDIKEAGLIKGEIAQHWYYRAKLAALRSLLTDCRTDDLLDVGAGMGFFARELLLHTNLRQATCVDPGYDADSEEVLAGKTLHFRRQVDRSDADLVLMMDVLEHVPDDVGLLREYVAKAASGTHFVVTVPAFMWLWSGHDVFLEHYRRYTLKGIEQVVSASGLRVERGCYFYGALLPLVAAARLAARLLHRTDRPPQSQMRQFNPLLNAAFGMVCRAELAILRANRLAGLTVFVRAVKP